MRHRGLRGNVTRGTRVMAGLRSRALGPGARSWLTSVAGPRFESAARTSFRTPHVERREAPRSFTGTRGRLASVPSDGLAGHLSGVSHTPASAGAPLPSRERDETETRACPGPTKEYGR